LVVAHQGTYFDSYPKALSILEAISLDPFSPRLLYLESTHLGFIASCPMAQSQ
jgi:hypothetical protein